MTSPQKYRRRPVEVEAMQWTGENEDAMRDFLGYAPVSTPIGSWWVLDATGISARMDEADFAATYEKSLSP